MNTLKVKNDRTLTRMNDENTILVRIKYQSFFRDHVGKNEEQIRVKETSLRALIMFLIKKYGTKFGDALIDPKTWKKKIGYNVFINGKFADLDVPLSDADEVVFLPPLAGG